MDTSVVRSDIISGNCSSSFSHLKSCIISQGLTLDSTQRLMRWL